MIQTAKKTRYKAFGLNINSELYLPELQISFDANNEDIFIKIADLSELWSNLVPANKRYLVKKNFVLFKIDETAIYLVEDGKHVIVSPYEGADMDKIRLYVLGTCMGALLMQRGLLPLHGSAVAINGKAYAFVGDSGAGKSTLASAFLRKGYELLSDDVIPVSLYKGMPIVIPAYPQQKLWHESLQQFGMDSSNLTPIFNREKKFAVPLNSQFLTTPLPLAGVFEIIKTTDGDTSIVANHKLSALHTIFKHTYRNIFINPSGLLDWHFKFSIQMLEAINCYSLQRNTNNFTANELVELVLTTINGGGRLNESQ